MKITDNLKKIRADKDYSLEKAARLADLSLNMVVKIESGVNQNPTNDTLSKIARALKVDVDILIQKQLCQPKTSQNVIFAQNT